MNLLEISNIDSDKLYQEIEKQFPKSEMKQKDIFEKIIENPKYKIFYILNDNKKVCGYFTFFELEDNTIIIDYFAIYKECHGQGLGSKTFEKIKKEFSYKGCYLEVEKKNKKEINTIRRAAFYEKLGAKLLDIDYCYPNIEGGLPMDLYFMPFRDNYMPDAKNTLTNIKNIFENMHFDITNIENIYKKIREKSPV